MVADVQCLLQCLHAIGIAFDALHAEEVRRGTCREHEIVIGDLAVVREQHAPRLVDALRLRHEELDVLVLAEIGAHRVRNLILGEDGGRNLIEERLKEVEIVTIHQRDLYVLLCERLRELDPAKPGAADHNMRLLL